MNRERLLYLDGIKGICTILIVLFHTMLTFNYSGYIGWSCAAEGAADPSAWYWQSFPYSVLANNSFPLYLFISIMAFIPAYYAFRNGTIATLRKKAVTRYFRFLPTLVIAACSNFIFTQLGAFDYQGFYDITGNNWILARLQFVFDIPALVKDAFFSAFVQGTNFSGTLWIFGVLYLGSLLAYGIIAIVFPMKQRQSVYLGICALLFFTRPEYLSIMAGIISADYLCQVSGAAEQTSADSHGFKGFIMLATGLVAGHFPPVLLPSYIPATALYALGSLLLLNGAFLAMKESRLLSNRLLALIAKESLTIIVFQFELLTATGIPMYIKLHEAGVSEPMNIMMTVIINLICTTLFATGWHKSITPLTDRLCSLVADRLGI